MSCENPSCQSFSSRSLRAVRISARAWRSLSSCTCCSRVDILDRSLSSFRAAISERRAAACCLVSPSISSLCFSVKRTSASVFVTSWCCSRRLERAPADCSTASRFSASTWATRLSALSSPDLHAFSSSCRWRERSSSIWAERALACSSSPAFFVCSRRFVCRKASRSSTT